MFSKSYCYTKRRLAFGILPAKLLLRRSREVNAANVLLEVHANGMAPVRLLSTKVLSMRDNYISLGHVIIRLHVGIAHSPATPACYCMAWGMQVDTNPAVSNLRQQNCEEDAYIVVRLASLVMLGDNPPCKYYSVWSLQARQITFI